MINYKYPRESDKNTSQFKGGVSLKFVPNRYMSNFTKTMNISMAKAWWLWKTQHCIMEALCTFQELKMFCEALIALQ